MITVTFYGLSPTGDPELIGRIIWDDSGIHTDTPQLQGIMNLEVKIPGGRRVYAYSDPAAWMQALHLNFRSPYFLAEPPEVTTPAPAPVVA